MNELYLKLRRNLGLSLILLIGLGVEFSNFQSMFFKFMMQYRPDWGAFNHIPAIFLSAFLLLCIVIFGIRRQVALSWFLALLTCVVSFTVYSRMNLSWKWEEMNEVHFVILILSGMLPLLVAYTTHQITHDNEEIFDHPPSPKKPYKYEGEDYVTPPRHFTPPYPHLHNNGHNGTQNHVRQVPKGKYGIGQVDYQQYNPPYEHRVSPPYQPSWSSPQERNQTHVSPPKDELTARDEQLKATAGVAKPSTEPQTEMLRREVVFKVAKNTAADSSPDQTEGGYLITCQHCGKQSIKKNKAAKYCSQECRHQAQRIKAGNGSGSPAPSNTFEITRDEYETNGVMEWVNVG